MEIKKPSRPDCNSCYHFSKCDFNETEGYCKIRKEHLNPQEGLTCEQFEPHSLYCDTDSFVEDCPFRGNSEQYCPYYGKYCECDEDEQEVCDLFEHYKDNMKKLLDPRAIKPEKYAELREQDFDTWLDTILHEIIEQVNFDASEVNALGGAVWNGECPDGTPYPKQCEREDAYIQCIRTSNQLNGFMKNVDITVNSFDSKIELLDDKIHTLKNYFEDLESQISSLQLQFDELKKFIRYTLADPAASHHTCSNFCGNCCHCSHVAPDVTYRCELSGEDIDPDDSSCAMFEPPF